MSNLTKKDLTQLTDVNKQIEALLQKKEEQEQKLFIAVGKHLLKHWNTPEYPDSLMNAIEELATSANSKMELLDNAARDKNSKKIGTSRESSQNQNNNTGN